MKKCYSTKDFYKIIFFKTVISGTGLENKYLLLLTLFLYFCLSFSAPAGKICPAVSQTQLGAAGHRSVQQTDEETEIL